MADTFVDTADSLLLLYLFFLGHSSAAYTMNPPPKKKSAIPYLNSTFFCDNTIYVIHRAQSISLCNCHLGCEIKPKKLYNC